MNLEEHIYWFSMLIIAYQLHNIIIVIKILVL